MAARRCSVLELVEAFAIALPGNFIIDRLGLPKEDRGPAREARDDALSDIVTGAAALDAPFGMPGASNRWSSPGTLRSRIAGATGAVAGSRRALE